MCAQLPQRALGLATRNCFKASDACHALRRLLRRLLAPGRLEFARAHLSGQAFAMAASSSSVTPSSHKPDAHP